MTDAQPTPVDPAAPVGHADVKIEASSEPAPTPSVENAAAAPPTVEEPAQPAASAPAESNGHAKPTVEEPAISEEPRNEEPPVEETEATQPAAEEEFQLDTQPMEQPLGQNEDSGRHFARLRGLPYSATPDEIRKFFGDQIEIVDLFFLSNHDGKPNGEAYIRLATGGDLERALEKHRNSFGSRYVEVFQLGEVEINSALKRMAKRETAEYATIRVRGLPFSCKREDLLGFFKGLAVSEVVFGKEAGEWGRPTGEAYVRFSSQNDAEQAMNLNGQYLGRRYLELFHVDNDAFESFKQRMNAPQGPRPRPLADFEDPWAHYPPRGQQAGPGMSSANAQLPAFQTPYNYDPYSYEAAAQQPRGGSRNPYAQPVAHQYAQQQPMAAPAPQRYPSPAYGGHQQYAPVQRSGGWGAPARAYDYAPDPYGRSGGGYAGGMGGGGGYSSEQITPAKVHMRGLPYRVSADQIEHFFAPLPIVEIKLGFFQDGRASGDGIVEFPTPLDANEALKRDRNMIKNRYIELFPCDQMKLSPSTSYKTISGGGSGGYRGSMMPAAAPSIGPQQVHMGGGGYY